MNDSTSLVEFKENMNDKVDKVTQGSENEVWYSTAPYVQKYTEPLACLCDDYLWKSYHVKKI